MILRLMIILLAFATPVTAAETAQQSQKSYDAVKNFDTCSSCNNCAQRAPTGAELQRALQLVLNERILTSPQATTPLGLALLQILTSPQILPPFTILLQNIVTSSGIAGPPGPVGPPGPAGTTGSLEFADFYALMTPDNPVAVAAGSPVLFPRTGPFLGTIAMFDPPVGSQFILPSPGVYEVLFQLSVTAAGQAVIGLDDQQGGGVQEQAATVVGRATGASQIIGISFIRTTFPNTLLSIRNPLSGTTSLALTPFAGSTTNPVSAHLTITRIH